jgi:hypothetical protein
MGYIEPASQKGILQFPRQLKNGIDENPRNMRVTK